MKINTATLFTKSDFGINILTKQCMTIYDNGMQLLLCNYAAHCEKKNVHLMRHLTNVKRPQWLRIQSLIYCTTWKVHLHTSVRAV